MNQLRIWALALTLGIGAMACGGEEGTISVGIVAAPGSELLPRIDRIRGTFSNGGKTFEAERDSDGTLKVGIDFKADGRSGDLIVEGFDRSGIRIAVGRVGPLPLAAIDANVSVYLAQPQSIAEAPVSLDVPRSHIGGTEASFGALLAGGLGADGPVTDVDIYSTYLHQLQSGLPMPEARSNVAVVAGGVGFVYMLGGDDADGEARSESYAFDITVPPSGSYRPLVISAENARSGVTTAIVGQELYLVSGDPVLLLDGIAGTARPLVDGAGLDGPAATVVGDNRLQVVFGGAGVVDPELGGVGAAVYETDHATHLEAPPEMIRTQHRALTLPTAQVLFLGGAIDEVATTSAVLYSIATGGFEVIDLLATGRRNPAVALTNRYLVVVGGEDDTGAAIGDAELFDAFTLERVAIIPLLVPRKNAVAHALNNGQVLIAGGQDQDGAPIGLLSLFTPDETP